MMIAMLVISFFPSSKLSAADNRIYQGVLAVCFVISMAIPFVIYANRYRWNGSGTGAERSGGR